ncbi:MAG: ABC transporter permease [Lachnospiraceae bacterium]|nr:ABC transporter permease [Lachnospiraceae bacterium]
MRITELLRLVWLNINQNKFKTVMTSIGIIVGAATIVMVIAIGRGGQMDVAEQFASLNAGSIDITYEYEGEETSTGGSGSFSFSDIGSSLMSNISNMFSFGNSGGRGGSSDSSSDSGGGTAGGASMDAGMAMAGGGMTMGQDSSSDDSSDSSSSGRGDRGNFSDSDMSAMAEAFASGDVDMSDLESMMSGGMPDGASDGGENGGTEEGDSGGANQEASDGSGGGESSADASGDNDGDSANGSGEDGEAAASDEEMTGEEAESASEAETEAAAAAAEEETEEESDLTDDRLNQENIILTIDDVEDIQTFVTDIDDATISYTSRTSVEGGDLTEAETYTVAGVYYSYYTVSNLSMAEGEFITDDESDSQARVCVLGSTVAKELFGSAADAYGESLYLDDRAYEIVGVLSSSSTVSGNITPDESIFVPYETGIKYITGTDISPVITVICNDVNLVDSVKEDVETVLEENYSTAEFTFSDASSKLEAAESSNEILTMLLSAMAVIVFIVGGIGIMNVLFVSVKERTGEIGILKSLGASRSNILFEFLFESAAISLIGGILGVGASFLVTPIVEYNGVRVEANVTAWGAALAFSILTGTIFGFYPAWQASKLVPVEALNSD